MQRGGEAQIARWQAVRELNHPSLIRIFDTGRWELDGTALLYVVMEYAEENLSQILPERALTAEETLATLPASSRGFAICAREGICPRTHQADKYSRDREPGKALERHVVANRRKNRPQQWREGCGSIRTAGTGNGKGLQRREMFGSWG